LTWASPTTNFWASHSHRLVKLMKLLDAAITSNVANLRILLNPIPQVRKFDMGFNYNKLLGHSSKACYAPSYASSYALRDAIHHLAGVYCVVIRHIELQ
jgi:hypothetical protein